MRRFAVIATFVAVGLLTAGHAAAADPHGCRPEAARMDCCPAQESGQDECSAAAALGLEQRSAALCRQLARVSQGCDDWSGSLRYRWQAERRSGGAVRDERLSQQLELKLGYETALSSELRFALRLSTVAGDGFGRERFNYDPWFALGGSSAFSGARIGIDQAYVKYSPDWGGHYASRSGEQKPRFDVIGGRF